MKKRMRHYKKKKHQRTKKSFFVSQGSKCSKWRSVCFLVKIPIFSNGCTWAFFRSDILLSFSFCTFFLPDSLFWFRYPLFVYAHIQYAIILVCLSPRRPWNFSRKKGWIPPIQGVVFDTLKGTRYMFVKWVNV